MKNFGQIRIAWSWRNKKIKEMINNAILGKTYKNYIAKADRYRILKENFHNLGQYDEEDEAYVEFEKDKFYIKELLVVKPLPMDFKNIP